MTLMIQSWCAGDPCDPCKPKPPGISYSYIELVTHEIIVGTNGINDNIIGAISQISGSPPTSWSEPPIYVPPEHFPFVISITIVIKTTAFDTQHHVVPLPDVAAAGYDNASIQAAQQQALSQAGL